MSSDAHHSTFPDWERKFWNIQRLRQVIVTNVENVRPDVLFQKRWDYPPSVIMRMLQTGNPVLEDKVLRSFSIWVCLTCEMCFARCPMSIDIPKDDGFPQGEIAE